MPYTARITALHAPQYTRLPQQRVSERVFLDSLGQLRPIHARQDGLHRDPARVTGLAAAASRAAAGASDLRWGGRGALDAPGSGVHDTRDSNRRPALTHALLSPLRRPTRPSGSGS